MPKRRPRPRRLRLPHKVASLVEETRDLSPEKRIERLHEAMREAIAVRRLAAIESISVSYGQGSSLDFVTEDPYWDDATDAWSEITTASNLRGRNQGYVLLSSELALEKARKSGRRLAAENEFAIGALRLRRSYLVGKGIKWKATPKDLESENEKLTKRNAQAIKDFVRHNTWQLMEREVAWRVDRDGECFLRTYVNADGPLTVRFVEPELVKAPQNLSAEEAPYNAYGVKVDRKNPSEVVGFWIHEEGLSKPARLVKRLNPLIPEIPQIIHIKGNTDIDQRRGWPLMWPARKNLDRAEKLMRNMSVVAALQAAIAVIRKHEAASQADVEAFLADDEDLNFTDNVTGNSTSAKGLYAGTVLDTGPGVTYEAPISSVNASNNVEVLRAELRSVATMLNMPEFMFTSQIDGSFAGSLVAEAPFVKYMEGEQLFIGLHLRPVVEAALEHEVFWGRLPRKSLKDYEVSPEFTSLEVRDFLKVAQERQTLKKEGVLSTTTWRAMQGLDEATETRNLEREHELAMERQEIQLAMQAKANPPDSGEQGDNGEGGSNQQRKGPNSKQPLTNFAQKDAQHLAEAGIYPDQEDAISTIMQRFGHLMGKDEGSGLVLKLIGILTDSRVPPQERVIAALNLLATLEADGDAEPESDAGGEAIPGLPL